MTDKRWKAWEREVAKVLGGKRIPTSGSAQFEGEKGDVLHPVFEIECKYRKKILVASWFREVDTRAKESKKIPLLAIRERGMMDGALVVIRLKDLQKLLQTGHQIPL